MVNTDLAKHNVLVYVSIIQCDVLFSIIDNACRFGWDTSPCGIWTQMSYTVGWDSESNCGWIPLKKLSKYFAEVRRLDTCISAVVCKFCFVCYRRSSRKTFDTSETQKEIGPIIVQFGKVSFKLVYTSTCSLCIGLKCSFMIWILHMPYQQ